MATSMQNITTCTPSSFPVKTRQTAVEVNSIPTELLCTLYEDRILVVVTQYNKIGTLVNITRDNIVDGTGATVPMCSTHVLMGKDEPITHVIAKNLVAKLVIQKPVLLSMALKDSSAATIRALAQILPELV